MRLAGFEDFGDFYDDKELDAAADEPVDWIVEGCFASGANTVLGGPSKCLKTSLSIDLLDAIANGRPFLGRFKVPRPRRVLMFSMESTRRQVSRIKRRIREAYSQYEQGDPRNSHTFYKTVRVDDRKHRDFIAKAIDTFKAEVVLFDAAYRCVPEDATSSINRFSEIMQPIEDIARNAGCTLKFAHHATKHVKPRGWLQPSDLANSGWCEWPSQYFLVNRETEFKNDGKHPLRFSVNGRDGQMSRHHINVDEGPGVTKWDVQFADGPQEADANPKGLRIDDEAIAMIAKHGGLTQTALRKAIAAARGGSQPSNDQMKGLAKRLQSSGKVKIDGDRKLVLATAA